MKYGKDFLFVREEIIFVNKRAFKKQNGKDSKEPDQYISE
jgi:hypothetical protein